LRNLSACLLGGGLLCLFLLLPASRRRCCRGAVATPPSPPACFCFPGRRADSGSVGKPGSQLAVHLQTWPQPRSCAADADRRRDLRPQTRAPPPAGDRPPASLVARTEDALRHCFTGATPGRAERRRDAGTDRQYWFLDPGRSIAIPKTGKQPSLTAGLPDDVD